MLRRLLVVAPVAVFAAACSLFFDLNSISGADAGIASGTDSVLREAGGVDAAEAGVDSGPAHDSGSDASNCTCPGIVSAYRFEDPKNLGHDAMGNNDFADVGGSPNQSTVTPGVFGGHSMQLDGSSTICIDSGFTFVSTSDHSLCWWSRPTALGTDTDQFAQYCGYDTWTANGGADYVWHINNCNAGTAADLQVPNVYSVNTWVQICQTYTSASKTRTVVINGDTNAIYKQVDAVPIVEDPSAPWCIGSYGSGGYWTGTIYLPIWFDHALSDTEIQEVNATACCLP